jgi:predicted signal transduction protein with EAL and GGDEF domain
MKAFAEIASFDINREFGAEKTIRDKRAIIWSAIEDIQLSMVFQPICDSEAMRTVGFEPLAGFSPAPYRSPDKWFVEVAEVGMGVALEIKAIRRALSVVRRFPSAMYLGAQKVSKDELSSTSCDQLVARKCKAIRPAGGYRKRPKKVLTSCRIKPRRLRSARDESVFSSDEEKRA